MYVKHVLHLHSCLIFTRQLVSLCCVFLHAIVFILYCVFLQWQWQVEKCSCTTYHISSGFRSERFAVFFSSLVKKQQFWSPINRQLSYNLHFVIFQKRKWERLFEGPVYWRLGRGRIWKDRCEEKNWEVGMKRSRTEKSMKSVKSMKRGQVWKGWLVGLSQCSLCLCGRSKEEEVGLWDRSNILEARTESMQSLDWERYEKR